MAIATPELRLVKNGRTVRTSGRHEEKPVYASEMRRELEQRTLSAVMAGMLKDQRLLSDALDVCPASNFIVPEYVPFAEALDLLRKSGQRTDLVTLAVQMQERWASDSSRWPYPDMNLIGDMACSIWPDREQVLILAGHLAREAERGYVREKLIDLVTESGVYGVDPEDVYDKLRELSNRSVAVKESADVYELAKRVVDDLSRPDARKKVATPWDGLNEILRGGFAPGELVVLAARPGLGKTAFAVNAALSAARAEQAVLFVSCEMSEDAILHRMLSNVGRIDGRFFRDGHESAKEVLGAMRAAVEKFAGMPIKIVEKSTTQLCPREVRKMARCMEGLGLIVVDYLQLLNPDEKAQSREREVADMSRSFKQMALDLKTPVLLLSQLNRSSEDGREPRVSDLRESGAIEQDADIVILLHTPQESRSEAAAPVKAIVGKSRNSGIGSAYLRFEKAFSSFTETGPWKKRVESEWTSEF